MILNIIHDMLHFQNRVPVLLETNNRHLEFYWSALVSRIPRTNMLLRGTNLAITEKNNDYQMELIHSIEQDDPPRIVPCANEGPSLVDRDITLLNICSLLFGSILMHNSKTLNEPIELDDMNEGLFTDHGALIVDSDLYPEIRIVADFNVTISIQFFHECHYTDENGEITAPSFAKKNLIIWYTNTTLRIDKCDRELLHTTINGANTLTIQFPHMRTCNENNCDSCTIHFDI